MVLTATLRCICNDSFTDVLRVVKVLWLYEELGSCLLACPSNYSSIPKQTSHNHCLQLVSKQGSDVVVKTTTLFMQCIKLTPIQMQTGTL